MTDLPIITKTQRQQQTQTQQSFKDKRLNIFLFDNKLNLTFFTNLINLNLKTKLKTSYRGFSKDETIDNEIFMFQTLSIL